MHTLAAPVRGTGSLRCLVRGSGGDDSEGADARPHIAVTEPFEQPDGAAGVLRMISSPQVGWAHGARTFRRLTRTCYYCQSSALLEAKRRRRAAPMASDLGPRPAGDSFAAAGAERRAGSSRPATRVRPGLVSPTLRMEMDTGFRPSSPQVRGHSCRPRVQTAALRALVCGAVRCSGVAVRGCLWVPGAVLTEHWCVLAGRRVACSENEAVPPFSAARRGGVSRY